MTKRTVLEQFEEAFAIAADDPRFVAADRWKSEARADFFSPLAKRIRRGDPQQLLCAETGACTVLGFLLMGVDDEDLPDRLEALAQMIVDERTMLIDMQTIAEGEPDVTEH